MGQTYPTVPITAAMVTPAFVRDVRYINGTTGDDVDTATAATAFAFNVPGPENAAYTPLTQAQKATMMGTTLAVDIARPRGWIQDDQPYMGNSTPPAAPVVSSISPTTGAAATLPLTVTITGTGFSPWSTVRTGGSATPDSSGKYLSPTQMRVALWAAIPGTVSVAVEDHDLLSNTDKLFTVT